MGTKSDNPSGGDVRRAPSPVFVTHGSLKSAGTGVVPYEKRLNDNLRWALAEGSRHFDEKSAVFEALRRIAARLRALNVPYAVIGGIALFRHGLRRFTEDVDILVTRDDLKMIHDKL